MTTGLVALDAPLPSPRLDDLLAVASVVPLGDDTWLSGGWSGGAPPGPAFTHDPCSSGTDRIKSGAGEIASQVSRLFNVYMPAFCTAQGVGTDADAFIGRLRDAFRVYESAAVERVLATGDGITDVGPYIADDHMEVLASTAQDPVAALRLLETAIARHGTGIIHAAPSTVVLWDAMNLTVIKGDLTFTKRGTPVAVGTGYIGIVPDGGSALAQDEQWAFATGPLEVRRADEIDVPASSYAEILDRSLNDVYVIAERPYLLNWLGRTSSIDDDHVQAGVLVNEAGGSCGGSLNGCGPNCGQILDGCGP